MVVNSGGLGEVYNIGGHNERTNLYIIKTIIDYLHENVDSKINESLITQSQKRSSKRITFSKKISTRKISKGY